MNDGVYALPGFMAPAAKNWKSQLLTNEDGSVKLCVYVGKPGTKVYYSLGIPGWKWGFIKDAQYFIDKGYPQEVIDEVSKFADYLEEEVTTLPEGTVIPDIIINGWPLPITESPIEGKVYWILNIPKFILPTGDTEVQISANGKLLKYTITRPDFSIHYNGPGYTISTGTTPGGSSGGSSTGGLTANERELLMGAAQRDADNIFTASNTFAGSVDLSTAQVTPPTGWNVEGAELTPEAIQQVVPIAWDGTSVSFGEGAKTKNRNSIAVGGVAEANSLDCVAVGYDSYADAGGVAVGSQAIAYNDSLALGIGSEAKGVLSTTIGTRTSSPARTAITIGAKFTDTADSYTCTTEGTGSITIGAGANTKNNGTTESSNSVTIGCKAENKGADSVVIGAQASGTAVGAVVMGVSARANMSRQIAIGANAVPVGFSSLAIGANAASNYNSIVIGESASANEAQQVTIGVQAAGGAGVAIGRSAANNLGGTAIGYGATAATCGTAIGYGAKSANTGAVVFLSRNSYQDNDTLTKTQLYFLGANTTLAQEYYNGEAFMGYTVTDKNNTVLACGTRRLSEIFTDNTLTQPASLDENGEWVQPKVFHPDDLDLPIENLSEPEEYQPLPVYPIVEPEIEDINLINAE